MAKAGKGYFLAEQGMADPDWAALVALFSQHNPGDRQQTARGLSGLAKVYRRHQGHWRAFEDAVGIVRLPLGRKAASKFQPACRHLCGLGLAGDESGKSSLMAAVMDRWEDSGIAPDQIPVWISQTPGGMRAIYEQSNRSERYSADSEGDFFTGRALARRIINYLSIEPHHFCVDCCRGKGSFYNALPRDRRDWCEIKQGRDFLSYDFGRKIDWIITNPDWSRAYTEISRRAFELAEHVVFLVRFDVGTNTYERQRAWRDAGHGLREVNIIPWADAEFTLEDGTPKTPEGFCLALLWWSKGWPDLFGSGFSASLPETAE